jgi:hypothetical protein
MGLLDLSISGLRGPDDSARSSSSIILAMFGDELDLDNPRLSVDGSSFNFVVYFFGAVNKYDGFELVHTILKTNIGQDASEVESSTSFQ